ncbi:MAG: transglutaminase-like domain-containing protein [Planctomycetota bacterium]|jgi:hypothetical protein
MNQYMASTEIIDWKAAAVLQRAADLAAGNSDTIEVARACFEWVRDCISHSGDCKVSVSTCSASEVLREAAGWCFAKSHLLAALLRANGIPAGFCYQRLRLDDGRRFTLHGFNAAHLPDFGWYRVDARGNSDEVDAQFCPPEEKLAWTAREDGEVDFPEIWPDPAPVVVRWLRRSADWQQMEANMPDISVI